MSVASANTLQTSLQVQGFSRLLATKALIDDIFVYLNENYADAAKKPMPDAIYLTVSDVQTYEHTHKLGMLMPLSGSPTYGNTTSQVGREENQVTKSVTIYKNDYSHAITNQLFGIDAQDKRFYSLLERETDQLALYFKELEGLHIRQALLERYAENLFSAAPTSSSIAREWSPNWYVKNVSDTAQPAFSQTLQTFTNNIVTALNAQGNTAVIDFKYLLALENWMLYAAPRKIRQLAKVGSKGGRGYIVTIPSRQAVFLRDPTRSNSFGTEWVKYNRLTDEQMNWPNVLGKFGTMVLVEDPRSPTLLPAGSAAPYTLTANYLYPGDNDERSNATAAKDVGFGLGQGALIKWVAEALHYEIEDANTYRKRRGRGAFGTYGIQQVQYDRDSANQSATTREQFSSMVLAFPRVAVANY